MANTRTLMNSGADHDSDPHDDLGYVPRGGDIPPRPYKAKTGKYGAKQAAEIDEDERVATIERASLATLNNTPEDERLAARDRMRQIRKDKLAPQNGKGAVADSVQIEVVQPDSPQIDPVDQAGIASARTELRKASQGTLPENSHIEIPVDPAVIEEVTGINSVDRTGLDEMRAQLKKPSQGPNPQ